MPSPNIHQYRLLHPDKPHTIGKEELGADPAAKYHSRKRTPIRWRFVFFAVFLMAAAASVAFLVYSSFPRINASSSLTQVQNTGKPPESSVAGSDVPTLEDGPSVDKTIDDSFVPDDGTVREPGVETENGGIVVDSNGGSTENVLNDKVDNGENQTEPDSGATESEAKNETDQDDGQASSTDPDSGTPEDKAEDGPDVSIDADSQSPSETGTAEDQTNDGTDESNDAESETPSTVAENDVEEDTDKLKDDAAEDKPESGSDDSSDHDGGAAPSSDPANSTAEDDTDISKDGDKAKAGTDDSSDHDGDGAPSSDPANSTAEDDTDISEDGDKAKAETDNSSDHNGDGAPSSDHKNSTADDGTDISDKLKAGTDDSSDHDGDSTPLSDSADKTAEDDIDISKDGDKPKVEIDDSNEQDGAAAPSDNTENDIAQGDAVDVGSQAPSSDPGTAKDASSSDSVAEGVPNEEKNVPKEDGAQSSPEGTAEDDPKKGESENDGISTKPSEDGNEADDLIDPTFTAAADDLPVPPEGTLTDNKGEIGEKDVTVTLEMRATASGEF